MVLAELWHQRMKRMKLIPDLSPTEEESDPSVCVIDTCSVTCWMLNEGHVVVHWSSDRWRCLRLSTLLLWTRLKRLLLLPVFQQQIGNLLKTKLLQSNMIELKLFLC